MVEYYAAGVGGGGQNLWNVEVGHDSKKVEKHNIILNYGKYMEISRRIEMAKCTLSSMR